MQEDWSAFHNQEEILEYNFSFQLVISSVKFWHQAANLEQCLSSWSRYTT